MVKIQIFSLRSPPSVCDVRPHSPRQRVPPLGFGYPRQPTGKLQPAAQPPSPAPTVDVRAEMLGDLKLPTAPIPPEVAKAIECRAWDLAFEARDICKQHLLRRIAYEAQHNHPRHYIDTHKALQAIARGNLDEALAYNWSTKLDTMQVLARSHRDLAAKLVRDLEAVLAGGKRIGNV